MTLVKRLCAGVSALVCAAAVSGAANAMELRPLSPTDAAGYAAAFDAADRGDFIGAQMKAVEIKDKSLEGYLSFRQLMHPQAPKATFEDLSSWLSKFRDLPVANRVFSQAAKQKPAEAADPMAPELSDDDLAHASLPTLDIGKLAREAFYSGDAAKALEYAPAAGERWIAGLSAYRLARFDQAQGFFAAVAQDANEDPWLRAAAGFWAARTANALNDPGAARTYLRLAAQFPTTFYGLIADRQMRQPSAAETGQLVKASFRTTGPSLPYGAASATADADLQRFADGEPRAHRAAALVQLGRVDDARDELRAGLALARTDKERASWSKLIEALGAAKLTRTTTSSRRGSVGPSEYPVPDLQPANGFTVDKALVYAIAYQESRFNPQAQSPVGAMGIMQLMPDTAVLTTGDDRLKKQKSQLLDPALNMRIGQEYLQMLSNRWVGYDIMRVVAAYNGGPGSVLKTLQKVGNDVDPLMLIECLPAQETRDYVEKVMTAYWTYRRQWGQDTPTLDALVRGERIIDARLDLVQPDPIGALLASQGLQAGLP